MNDQDIIAELPNPDKVLFPDCGITKLQLAEYYLFAYKYMEAHIWGRPISMERFPNGISEKGFYQKEAAEYFPAYIKRIEIPLKSVAPKPYVWIDNRQTLAYLAGQANISVHTWLSRVKNLKRPDIIVWDLDPSDGDFEKVREAAFLLKEELERYSISPFVKTTGSKGVHVEIPVHPDSDFEESRAFALGISRSVVESHPKLLTLEMSIADRGDKVFVDYLRNSYGATAVAPYSVRPKKGAPVAMPLSWNELQGNDIVANTFGIKEAMSRLKNKNDIWADFRKSPVKLKNIHLKP